MAHHPVPGSGSAPLSLPQTQSDRRSDANRTMHRSMADLLKLMWWAIIGLFRSRASLEAEILMLRHQLNVLRRKSPKRLTFSHFDRLIFSTLYRFAPGIVSALAIVEPCATCCARKCTITTAHARIYP